MSLNLVDDIRTSLLANSGITALLSTWNDAASVHTRRPVPKDAPYPLIVVAPVDVNDIDALSSKRPITDYDVIAYGRQKEDYRNVENLGFLVRDLFHRERFSITPTDITVVNILCRGPRPAPAEDDSFVARVVNMRITLKQ